MDEWPAPRELARKGNFPYKFRIQEDYTFESTWQLETAFRAEWLEISTSGQIRVKANKSGYAWDGCTPKWSILNLFFLGTPDGHVNYRTMKPYTYYASLVHDVLYQYLDSIPVAKAEVDLLFLHMLGDFKPRKIYYLFVKYLGARGVKQYGI